MPGHKAYAETPSEVTNLTGRNGRWLLQQMSLQEALGQVSWDGLDQGRIKGTHMNDI